MSNFEEQLRTALAGAYEIERELLGGGMSRVFVATDRHLGRKVVIKVLPPELTAGVNRERFRREIQVAAQLQHPHIVTLLSAGEEGDLLYYTMPYIEGESLRHALEQGKMPVKEVVRVLHDVVDALAYAHSRGVIHRDIKPANILRQGSHALVTDFGVAKALSVSLPVSGITTAGMAIGTPAYMAPEQLAGDPAADHRVDIYAVGLLAYELLTGESPFTGPSPAATMAAQLTRDPEPLHLARSDVPPPLSGIIMQCMAKAPEKRPQTADALMQALDGITTSSGEIKTASGGIYVPRPSARRVAMTAGLATLVLGSAVAVFASQQRGVRPRAAVETPAVQVAAVANANAVASAAPNVAEPAPAPRPSPAAEPKAPTSPIVLSRKDSLAIAAAVERRLAREEAVLGKERVLVMADSIAAHVKKVAMDSIVRVHLPRGAPMVATWGDFNAFAAPPAPPGPRRVVVTTPRESRDPDLTAFGGALAEEIRASLVKRPGFKVVSRDSVDAVLRESRVRSDVERALKPDLLISPTLAGAGDTLTLLVMVRDLKLGSSGTRAVSMKVERTNLHSSIPDVVQKLAAQIATIPPAPPSNFTRFRTNVRGEVKKADKPLN